MLFDDCPFLLSERSPVREIELAFISANKLIKHAHPNIWVIFRIKLLVLSAFDLVSSNTDAIGESVGKEAMTIYANRWIRLGSKELASAIQRNDNIITILPDHLKV
ncbi:MAG: hypothetical protein J7527_13355 [Chitinophagaceae bacterium]|nr:hypothetical protein [Chitinophagaceae bacterium]